MPVRATVLLLLLVMQLVTVRCRREPTGDLPEIVNAPPQANGLNHHETALRLRTVPEQPRAGELTRLEFEIRSGAPLRLEPIANHTMHFFVVNETMTWKEHLHPAMGNSVYADSVRFPAAGRYVVYTIYQPFGRAQVVNRWPVPVQAGPAAAPSAPPQLGDYCVSLKSDPSAPVAGQWTTLVFTVSKNEQPVTYLTPSGSLGHIVILREGPSDFVYAHSTDGEAMGGVRARTHSPAKPAGVDDHAKHTGDTGPDVTFHTRFPQAGRYKIWAQFQAGADTIEPEFTIDVVEQATRRP